MSSNTFVVHMAIQKWEKMVINPVKKTIIKTQAKTQIET